VLGVLTQGSSGGPAAAGEEPRAAGKVGPARPPAASPDTPPTAPSPHRCGGPAEGSVTRPCGRRHVDKRPAHERGAVPEGPRSRRCAGADSACHSGTWRWPVGIKPTTRGSRIPRDTSLTCVADADVGTERRECRWLWTARDGSDRPFCEGRVGAGGPSGCRLTAPGVRAPARTRCWSRSEGVHHEAACQEHIGLRPVHRRPAVCSPIELELIPAS